MTKEQEDWLVAEVMDSMKMKRKNGQPEGMSKGQWIRS